jgi:protein-arginine kinase activator protein McsA
MKCELCKKNIEEIFLKKIVGTVIKDEKGKKHYICAECQKKENNDKTTILTKL